ncbi:MAG: cytochrome c oxidase assembly protein, partial [Anaerolineaceae bacterium]
GITLVGVAVLSPIEHYGNTLLWVNFTGFLILTMLAAPLILLGSPLTLAFRVSNRAWRKRLRQGYRNPVLAVVSFPAATWFLFALVTYVWQFSGLTDDAARNAFLRDFQQFTLLAVALLFWQPVVSADPQRWRLPYPLRAFYVLVEMTHKGLFGGMFLSMNHPMHDYFAASLPAWGPGPMTDQRLSILILWIGGNMIFVLALVCLVVGWVRYEQRATRRTDRQLEKNRIAVRAKRTATEQVFRRGI